MADTPSSHGIVPSDPQNNADPKGIHTRSTFTEDDLGYSFYATLPFGEIRPFTFFETVPDDKRIRAQFISQVNSYTLKAPIMQGIHMKKLLCQVPREAILPFNWDKWFKNPVIGQDVPDDVGTSVYGFWHLACDLNTAYQGKIPSTTTIDTKAKAEAWLQAWFKHLIIAEMFYSDGNLLKHCNISGRPWCWSLKSDGHTQNTVDYVFDKFVNRFVHWMHDTNGWDSFYLAYGTTYYTVEFTVDPNKTYPTRVISMREALALMRDDLSFTIEIDSTATAQQLGDIDNFRLETTVNVEYFLLFKDDTAPDPDKVSVDLKRLWAYQLCCAHFLTNDSVDFVFTAELYRQYVYQLVSNNETGSGQHYIRADYFMVNGLQYQYDFLSAYYFKKVIGFLLGSNLHPHPNNENEGLAYLVALLSFKRSLRYLDYFTGCKTRPLAVGDVKVGVVGNQVNVVDTQAKTFLARFLNVINRTGMRNYVEGVFNVKQAPDWHNPQYLIKLDDIVNGERVENTASEQWTQPNSVTSLLHGSSDRFAFEMDFDRSSVLIGMAWFDIDRVYSMATERQNLHLDRFDEFQPFMQYTGDQALMKVELGAPLTFAGAGYATDPFGYKLRNCEYKERFDQCAGGFCNDMLDGYIFKADILESSAIQNQSPSFIRSFPSELDRFYLSLTGYSLATYWHFIVKFVNLWSGSRPMAYAPTLM